jgi:hypothetical protein
MPLIRDIRHDGDVLTILFENWTIERFACVPVAVADELKRAEWPTRYLKTLRLNYGRVTT